MASVPVDEHMMVAVDDIFLYYFLIKWINDERTKVRSKNNRKIVLKPHPSPGNPKFEARTSHQ